MSQPDKSPLEAILRWVAAAAPRPWYPRLHAQQAGVSLDSLNYFLEHLWLDGLLRKADAGTPESGAGLTLSPEGERVLADPAALRRLTEGRALTPGDRGGVVREAVRRVPRPLVGRLLLLANVAVFAWGAWLARGDRATMNGFLSFMPASDPAVTKVLHDTGAVVVTDLVRGEWWRLLTCCFVHIGLLHIIMNMMMLRSAGRQVEQMWGPGRFLLIYALSGLGGSVLAMAYQKPLPPPGPPGVLLAGASGALCGLVAAEAVWVLLNGRYLPGQLARRWRWNLVTTGLLLTFISLFPGISGLGHLGGAVVGAAVALPLNAQRFGRTRWRWAALAPLLALPAAGWWMLDRARATNSAWHRAEEVAFDADWRPRIEAADAEAEELSALMDVRKVADLFDRFQDFEGKMAGLTAGLGRAGPYRGAEAERKRAKAADHAEKLREWAETRVKSVESAARKKKSEDQRHAEERQTFAARFGPRVTEACSRGLRAFEDGAAPVVRQAPGERAPEAKRDAAKVLTEQIRALDGLLKEIDESATPEDALTGEIRTMALSYTHSVRDLLALAQRCLRTGTPADDELGQQEKKARERQAAWKALLAG